jgi:hypothetical protein
MSTQMLVCLNDQLSPWQRRLEHVYCQLFSGIREFRLVTKQGVECVLKHPPKNPRTITMAELNRINRTLLVPLTPTTIREIIAIANDYDREYVAQCDNKVVGFRKSPVSTKKHESDNSKHHTIFGEPRYA